MKLKASDPLGRYVMVTLGGLPVVLGVVEVDETGTITLLDRDEHGRIRITPNCDAATVTVRGTVRILLRPDAPQWAREMYLEIRDKEMPNANTNR